MKKEIIYFVFLNKTIIYLIAFDAFSSALFNVNSLCRLASAIKCKNTSLAVRLPTAERVNSLL